MIRRLLPPTLAVAALLALAACGGAPDPTTIERFDADPSAIVAGESSTLRWKVVNATGCTLTAQATGEAPGAAQTVACEDSRVVTPAVTTEYTLRAERSGGDPLVSRVNVDVTVPQGGGTLAVEASTLYLSGDVSSDAVQMLSLVNGSAGSAAYTITDASDWLRFSQTEGTVQAGTTATIAVSATCPSASAVLEGGFTVETDEDGAAPIELTTFRICTPAAGAFDIEVRFFGDGFTVASLGAFVEAAARWEEVITGDLADIPLTVAENYCGLGEPAVDGVVDDLLIQATTFTQGPGGVLGSAGPCLVRSAGALPFYGLMRFDTADIEALLSDGEFDETVLHEMGHVLGIGTMWEYQSLLDFETTTGGTPPDDDCAAPTGLTAYVPGGEPEFLGSEAVAEYAVLGGSGNVPVEDGGGAGTQCGHWDEEIFDNELMTGYLGGETAGVPLSRLTVASLADLGYAVDASSADAYTLPPCSGVCGVMLSTQAAPLRETLLLPKAAAEPDGTLVEPR